MTKPSDLLILPTMPWDERPSELPLDPQECRTALWQTRGNITKAAGILKVAPARLRRFVKGSAFLSAEMEEAKEQMLDIVEDNIIDALTDATDPGRKDSMTRFVAASLGRSRGFGNGSGGITLQPTGSGTLQIVWGDNTPVGEPGDKAKVINGND